MLYQPCSDPEKNKFCLDRLFKKTEFTICEVTKCRNKNASSAHSLDCIYKNLKLCYNKLSNSFHKGDFHKHTKVNERSQPRSAHFLSRFCRHFLTLLSKHPKFVFAILAIIFVFCLVVSTVSTHRIDSKTTAFGFRDIGELATQVGYFTNVQIIEDNQKLWGLTLPFTTSTSIFSYDGSIKAGIDFSKIEYYVDTKKKVVSMPAPAIRSVEVDENSLMIYDEKSASLHRSISVTFLKRVKNCRKPSYLMQRPMVCLNRLQKMPNS